MLKLSLLFKSAIFLFFILCPKPALAVAVSELNLGQSLPIWSTAPFLGILFSIAFFPLANPHFWHKHYGKVSAFWALVFILPFLWFYREIAFNALVHIILIDYIPFIILLWGLFTISGGIVFRGSLRETPFVNTVLLLVGTFLASWVGTTGASMVMIRPVLKANQNRIRKTHVICFFIFLVSNIGGALTPLGDPPLFLGFLHNVPFFWVTKNLFPHTLLATAILLAIFYGIDTYFYNREENLHLKKSAEEKVPFHIEGFHNLFLLAGIIGAIIISGNWQPGSVNILGVNVAFQNLMRDGIILILGLLSLKTTKIELHEANDFSWRPIVEVAKLFACIFVTIVPALAILKAGGAGSLAVLLNEIQTPAAFFWISGLLSSFLDNAPTYLAFFNMALGKVGLAEANIPAALLSGSITENSEFIGLLEAISIGAVFMGANSYIGNAPNFMVKSIAEESGVNMPSFFGYIFKYSIPVLIPVFLVITFIFF